MPAVVAGVYLRSYLDPRLLLQHLQAWAAQPADDYRSSCRLGWIKPWVSRCCRGVRVLSRFFTLPECRGKGTKIGNGGYEPAKPAALVSLLTARVGWVGSVTVGGQLRWVSVYVTGNKSSHSCCRCNGWLSK